MPGRRLGSREFPLVDKVMTTLSNSTVSRLRYHPNAYQFVFAALRYAQERLGRPAFDDGLSEDAHISGAELLEGVRVLALRQFGLMTIPVFRQWGIESTDDFGRIVFELIERGEMKKTDRDQLADFFDIYSFAQVFDSEYQIDTSKAFQR